MPPYHTLVQSPFTTLGQETRWAYSTTPQSPHGYTHNQQNMTQIYT